MSGPGVGREHSGARSTHDSLERSALGRFVEPVTALLVSNLSLDPSDGPQRPPFPPSAVSSVGGAAPDGRAPSSRDRIRVHVVLGVVAWSGVFAFSSYSSLLEFAALLTLFVLGATCFIDAACIAWLWVWGPTGHSPPPLGWIDRAVVAASRLGKPEPAMRRRTALVEVTSGDTGGHVGCEGST